MIRKTLAIVAVLALAGCASLTPVESGEAATACAAGSNAINAAAPAFALYSPADQNVFNIYSAKIKADCNAPITSPAQVTQIGVDVIEAQRALGKLKAAGN